MPLAGVSNNVVKLKAFISRFYINYLFLKEDYYV